MPEQWSRLLLPLLLVLGAQQLASAGLIHAKAMLAPQLVAAAWEQTLARGGEAIKPWPWADTWPVARLQVPSLKVTRYVLAGDSGNALAFGPGHSLASAALGSAGLAVVGGHRDTHFAFLRELRSGQRITLELPGGQIREYRVTDARVVDASRSSIDARGDRERLLLVTCYPFDAVFSRGPLRYVISAEPVSEPSAAIAKLYSPPRITL